MDPKFIVVEGIDGVGSTTCSKLLAQHLNELGIDAVWTKEPTDGSIGLHLRRLLKGHESATEAAMFPLFLADRHDHIASLVAPELEQGSWVVTDRYAYSTWVYQQDEYEPKLIEAMHNHCLVPHHVFVLHAPVEVCTARMGERAQRELYEDEDKQRLYAERYRVCPQLGDERIHHLDASEKSAEALVLEMSKLLEL